MMTFRQLTVPALLAVLLFSCGKKAAETTSNTTSADSVAAAGAHDLLAFGMADSTGLVITSLDSIPQPERYVSCVVGGEARPVSVTGCAPEATDGPIVCRFNVSGSAVEARVVQVLMTAAFAKAHQQLAVTQAEDAPLPKAIEDSLLQAYQRKIKAQRRVATLGNIGQVYAIQFENRQDTAVASLVVALADRTLVYDFISKYDETSTWRVDDGGEFGVSYYEVRAAFLTQDGQLKLVTVWPGAEGLQVDAWMEEGGTTLRNLQEVYKPLFN